jgi:haloacetate dehalogenase
LLLTGFSSEFLDVNGVRLRVAHGGDGPPVLLLHGYPQTHAMWHRVAPQLAERFTVVCADLRGYGESTAPPGGEEHAGYSKRTMAQDQLAVMNALGFDRFAVVAHDRGARVALRLALDHPTVVARLALLDIVPTSVIYGTVDDARARTVWRYFFLTQAFDLPERLIGSNPGFYLRWTLNEWCSTPGALTVDAVAEYARCFDEATVHASCEDYRAGASIDLRHDGEDADEHVRCPLLVLWSASGLGRHYDVEAIWRRRATVFRGRALECGHFIAEERPEETVEELRSFLGSSTRALQLRASSPLAPGTSDG